VVTITALISIAERVGANRIFKAQGRLHHPCGHPGLPPEQERVWRADVLRAASRMLVEPVAGPTVRDARHLT
jgi:hypothetical protein